MNTSRFGKAQREDNSNFSANMSCNSCQRSTSHEHLVMFGARCLPCFESYCRTVPDYIHEKPTYVGDPKGWARRIIDKDKAGIAVRPIALRYARQALNMEVAA